MVLFAIAAVLQAGAAPAQAADDAALAARLDVLQSRILGMAGPIENMADELENVADDDPAAMAAAWARSLTVTASEMSWFRVEDPLLLSGRLALEFAASDLAIASYPDASEVSYSIGFDFYSRTGTPDAQDAAEDDGAGGEDISAPYCAGGEVERGERMTGIALALTWERCVLRRDTDEAPSGVVGMRYTLENGARATVAVAIAADLAETRDAMLVPARRLADTMAQSLMAFGPPAISVQD